MKITVCQLHDAPDALAHDWDQLVAFVRVEKSNLVVLPEMPFYPWFPVSRTFNPDVWRAAVAAHDAWEKRLAELAPAMVIATRPLDFGNRRYNTGFIWTEDEGVSAAHAKAHLPNEGGAWEAQWYQKATPEFVPVVAGDASIGLLIGTEMWAMDQARFYGEEGVHIIAVPRVTSASTLDKWLAGGCTAAVVSGAFCVSATRADDMEPFGGCGWVVSPDGKVLGTTSRELPFITVDIDPGDADVAKETYPRYAIFDVSAHRPHKKHVRRPSEDPTPRSARF
jgi:N-carbamoylputrescine amidase